MRVARLSLNCWTALLFFCPFALAQTGYVGAEVCGSCHQAEFASQSQSHHARSLHPASDAEWLQEVPEGTESESADSKAARFEFLKNVAGYQVQISVGTNQIVLPIQWIFGANGQGFTFFSRLDGGRFVGHRLTYYRRKGGFATTPGIRPQAVAHFGAGLREELCLAGRSLPVLLLPFYLCQAGRLRP
jgi:hypothetical protein